MTAADDIDRVVEIERLAALDPIDYEVARAEAAKRLGMRARSRPAAPRKRRELGLETDDNDDGQGRAVKIADVLPWHEPVDGDQIATTLAAAAKIYARAARHRRRRHRAVGPAYLAGERVHHLAAPWPSPRRRRAAARQRSCAS